MINVSITTDGLDDLIRDLRAFDYRVHDLMPLAMQVRDAMFTQNMAARMAGVDADGYPFRELMDSTLRRHPYRGAGPPLAGMEMSSRVISGFEVDVIPHEASWVELVGHWPSMDEFLIYHVTGTRYMTQRNPVGITPAGHALIAQAFDDWMDNLAGGA